MTRHTKIATLLTVLLGATLVLVACSGDKSAEHMTRATKFLDSGQFRSATIELKNVLQKQPQSAQAWFTLGQVSLASGDYADAAHQFGNARKYGTATKQVNSLLAQALLGQRNFKQALEALDSEPTGDAAARAEIHVLRGRAYLGLKQPEKAKQEFAAALKLQPDYPAARVGQARLAWQAGDTAHAQELLAAVMQDKPSYARAWVVAGNFAYRQRRCDDVIDVFEHIQGLDDHALAPAQVFNARGHAAFCQLRQGHLEDATANIDILMQRGANSPYANYLKAMLAYLNKDYDTATTHVQKALSRMPDNLSGLLLFGMIKTQQGDLKGAQLQFIKAVKQAPDSVRARQLLASIYMRRDRPKQAIKVLQEALDADSSNARLLAQLGQASIRAGQQAEGLQYLEHSAQNATGNADLQMALAQQMAQAGGGADALALLQQMQAQGAPQTLKAELLKIKLHLRNKQPEKAIAAAQDLTHKHQDNVQYVRLLARVYAAAGQQTKARNTLQQALQTFPDNVNVHLDLGRLAVARGDYQSANKIFRAIVADHQDNVSALVALARTAKRQGHNAQMVSWLEKAVQAQPDNIAVRVALTRAYVAQDEAQKAVQAAKTLITKAPDNAELYKLQAIVLAADGQHDSALTSMKKAVSLAPDKVEYQLDLARMLIAQKQFVAATSELHQIRDDYPDSVPAAVMLARTQLQQGQPEAALATADSLRAGGEHIASSYALRGELLHKQKQYEAAAAAYARAYAAHPARQLALRLFKVRREGKLPHPGKSLQMWLQHKPDDTAVIAVLAQWYQTSGDNKAAIRQYRALLDRVPNNALVLNNLALIYFDEGDDRALDLAKKAHTAAPHNAAILDTLGWILVNQDKIKDGLPLLQEAATTTSEAEIQYHFAVALSRSGDSKQKVQAKQVLTKLLATDETFKSHADAVQLLRRLQQ